MYSMFQSALFDTRKRANLPLHRLPKIRCGITILLVEVLKSSELSTPNHSVFFESIENVCNIVRYTSMSKSLKYVEEARPYEKIIMVLDLTDFPIDYGDNEKLIIGFIHSISHYQQVTSIVINGQAGESHLNYDSSDKMGRFIKSQKLAGIYNDDQSIIKALQTSVAKVNYAADDSLVTFGSQERCLKNIHQNFIEHLCTRSYRIILRTMSYNSPEAKRQMLEEIRSRNRYALNDNSDVSSFGSTYDTQDAIRWYTRSDCVHEIINRVLRTEDVQALYIFRCFIMNLCDSLQRMTDDTRKKFSSSFMCYRGSRMKLEEIQNLCVDTLVSTNGFWSTSKDLSVAMVFAGIDPRTGLPTDAPDQYNLQPVLFEIQVDFNRSPNLIVADVSHLSMFPDEQELLFDLGTTFAITDKKYSDDSGVWHIQLISSSALDTFDQDYDSYVSHRLSRTDGMLLYGNLLAGALGEHKIAVEYFQRLLKVLPKDEDKIPKIYSELGRVYLLMGVYDNAKKYFRMGLHLFDSQSPKFAFDHGNTLFSLGMLYSELRDYPRAIRCYRRVITIYRPILPAKHLEIAKVISRLAYDLCQIGQLQEASDLIAEIENPISDQVFLTNPETQLFLARGMLHKALGDRKKALNSLQQALDLRERWSHKSHRFTAIICYEIATLYAEEDGQYERALLYAKRSFALRSAKVSPNKIELQESMELIERLSKLMDHAP